MTSFAWSSEEEWPLSVDRAFAEKIDLSSIRLAAVQHGGRIKPFEALAREQIKILHPSREPWRIPPVLLYLDRMLAPDHHRSSKTIYIRNKSFRKQLVEAIRHQTQAAGNEPWSEPLLREILRKGFVTPDLLDHPAVREVLAEMESDLRRTERFVQELYAAKQLSEGRTLLTLWRVVPPPGGAPLDPWHSLPIPSPSGAPDDSHHRSLRSAETIPGLPPEKQEALSTLWTELQEAWRRADAPEATRVLERLTGALSRIEPSLYPPRRKLLLESWYYRARKLTAGWLVYLAALAPLLLAAVYRFGPARTLGLALFGMGFSIHTLSIGIRWYLAGRIPNSNMYEAVMASSWFGALAAGWLEWRFRKRPAQNLPAFAASAYAMLAMMCAHLMPIQLNSDIQTVMPVLDRTIWLYIHTNMVIASYAFIFFSSVTALGYLLVRLTRRRPGTPLAGALDAATMTFMQLAFLMLLTGTILGGIWADVSWGRPWGWDPKEVFALNTWMVFLILLHVRMRVRDKALWTAWLAILGCAVMLFNWIAVNFVIVGLHSYA
jgi:cytochrome c-type biogenesis protein CcsB